LANAVARLENRLDPPSEEAVVDAEKTVVYPRMGRENLRREPGGVEATSGMNGAASPVGSNGHASGEDVVQLSEQEHSGKAIPLEARLLVRREAAAEAHHFERKSQSSYDHRGREQIKTNWFSTMMEKHPVITVFCTLVPTLALVGYVIYWMYLDSVLDGPKPATAPLQKGDMAQRWEDDPAAATAELVARLFLTAPSAKEAKDVVYQYEKIAEKFDELFEPVQNPGDYELTPKGQQIMGDGTKVYAFRVYAKGQEPRTLVVLPEGKMPKVHWEFFAEVGDMSWEEFMAQRPAESVMLRTFVQEGFVYTSGYTAEEWQCYLLHDRTKRHVVYGYARKNSGEDWNLNNELKSNPLKIGRFLGIRAQLELAFMAEVEQAEEERIYITEIKGVTSTNWLPERFVKKESR